MNEKTKFLAMLILAVIASSVTSYATTMYSTTMDVQGLVEQEVALDEVLEMLDRTTKRFQKTLEESKEAAARQTPIYEQILLSKEAPEAQKVKALFGKAFELDRLERLSAQLSLLYTLQIFAFKVKVLEIEVANIDEQLEKSGILEKHMEIESIKKNIDALKILVEAQYESLKEIKDNQDKNLRYVY